jgi:dihydroneopterin aldolase
LTEEAQIGSHYLVDLAVEVSDERSAQTDRLNDTVDYVLLARIAREEMAVRAKLLETVVLRIGERILREAPSVDWAQVRVAKLSPPIDADVERVTVQMEFRPDGSPLR